MRWKQVFPLIGVVAVIGGLLAIFWFTRERDEETIRRITLEHFRKTLSEQKLVEGRDLSIGEITPFQRKGEVALVDLELRKGADQTHVFYRVRFQDGGWVIDADLAELFGKEAATQEFTTAMQGRLGALLSERWRISVEVSSAGEQMVFALRRDGEQLYAQCVTYYSVRRTDGVQRVQYIEDFRYVDGAWVVEYQGRWLEQIR